MKFFSSEEKFKQYPTIMGWQKDLGKALAGLLGETTPDMMSRVMERESLSSIASDWGKLYATPVMNEWQRTIAPTILEGYNLPGSFYSRSTYEGLGREAGDYLSGKVAPTLFAALEGARSRELSRQSLLANLLGVGAGFATTPTMQTVRRSAQPGWLEQLFGGPSGGAGSSMGADTMMLMRNLGIGQSAAAAPAAGTGVTMSASELLSLFA